MTKGYVIGYILCIFIYNKHRYTLKVVFLSGIFDNKCVKFEYKNVLQKM